MPKVMKNLNNVSRAQAVFRARRLPIEGLLPSHHTLLLAVCRMAGRSQDEIAQDICLSKSAASRALGQLEERGYIRRIQSQEDKRCFEVYPTEKAEGIIEELRSVAGEWNDIICSGISEADMLVFEGVLSKMEKNARNAIQSGGVS